MARAIYHVRIWARNILSAKGIAAFSTPLAAAVFISHVSDALFDRTTIRSDLLELFNRVWWVFFVIGLVWALYVSWPRLRFSARLGGRDVCVSLLVGNILELPGAIVIGSNTTFDVETRNGLISTNSIQGQFTVKYYGGSIPALEAEVTAGLHGIPSTTLDGGRRGKSQRFAVGTVVKLNPKGRVGYLLAVSDINEHGTASTSFEDLKTALAELWVHLGSKGSKDERVLLPIIGTGFGRLAQTREHVFRETVRSFVAACAESSFCDDLTIVLHAEDLVKHKMEFRDLCEFLNSVCKYTEFASANGAQVGSVAA